MPRIVKKAAAFLQRLPVCVVAGIKSAWRREPARVVSVTVTLVLFIASKLGVVVPEADVVKTVTMVLPVLLGGELIRSQVSPTKIGV